MAKATSKEHPETDLCIPPGAPPAYITTQQGSGIKADTVIWFPVMVVNKPTGDGGDVGPDSLVPDFDFTDKQIRQGIIRKVYSIIMAQLALTAGVAAWFMYDARLMRAVYENQELFLGVSVGTYLTTTLCRMCCEGPRRCLPYNYIFLLLLTLSLSALVGVMCSLYDVKEVLIAGGITFAIVLALTIFAIQTKIDFTVMSGSIRVLRLVPFLFGVAAVVTPYPGAHQLNWALGVLVTGMFLARHTQLIVGGDHRYTISPEDYVSAALAIYHDIMYIFFICVP